MSNIQGLVATPSQTVGPFLHIGLVATASGRMSHGVPEGERIRLRISVLDGDAQPVSDALVELCYQGVFGRLPTGEDGACEFDTVRPGTVAGTSVGHYFSVCVFARGLLRQLHTRIYFPGDAVLDDAVLALVAEDRRGTLMAVAEATDQQLWRFDIRLQGTDETVFFNI